MAIRTLSAAYFDGDLRITNISGETITELANLRSLQLAIAKYEPIYLKELLGLDLYTSYAAGIAAGSPASKWVDLNNQIYYEDDKLTDLNTGLSPAANYVYFFYQRREVTITMVNAEVKATHENFTSDSPNEKMITAWNEMVRMSAYIQDWIRQHITDYPEYYTSKVSPTDYTSIEQYLNSFGI